MQKQPHQHLKKEVNANTTTEQQIWVGSRIPSFYLHFRINAKFQ